MPNRSSAGTKDAETSVLTPFELSRVYARGWLAGMSCDIDAEPDIIDARGQALNPCATRIERTRWMDGFTAAVLSKTAHPGRRRPPGIAKPGPGSARHA